MSQLTVKKLELAYEGNAVVKCLSFEVKKGEYLCVVGENGSGKSTLMKSILGLIKPQSGEISFSDGAKVGRIGYLPQHGTAQADFPASVKEVVMSAFAGKTVLPWFSKTMKKKCNECLELLKVSDLRERPFRDLSGGQQQRVLLARALCATENMLLLDEPVNGLDPTASADMYSVIGRLNDRGMTVIMITHDVSFAVENATKILHLKQDGHFFGTASDYLLSGFGDELLKGGLK